ncbi:rod shape-determining protein MreD [Gallaecimonas xiamenensis]|uniref:Rod shape-determining protein MreD n=1 Tax=Gallaecimonas xiamenensis 3-C-1 TaxID=745411 RepID=K2JRF7_9GAMM|nr:rod shape-determining protein MreD [Gallaecimonas xiamenensis]EKE67735.1 rod shape-determining protein MreD [Gallaecimonas xiamenensis 3-C-1]
MNFIVIGLSLLVAMVLAMLPMPLLFDPFRPDWLALVLLYWSLALPHRVSVGVAWFCGLVMDILLGSTMGVHALALTMVIYVAALNFQKIRNFSLWQQSAIVGLLVAAKLMLVYWVEHVANSVAITGHYFFPALTSAAMWFWLFPLLRRLRRRFRIR